VLGVLVAGQKADGHGLNTDLVDQLRGRPTYLIGLESDEDRPGRIDSLGYFGDSASLDDGWRVALKVVVDYRPPGAAGDPEGVLESGGHEHADSGVSLLR
jgi:hypothetical protein